MYLTKTAAKELLHLPSDYQKLIREKLKALEDDIKSPALDIKPFYGLHPGSYRLRVGKARIIYYIQGEDIIVYAIGFRGDIY